MADFQNRVLEKYATEKNIPFLDVAGQMPLDPDLFTDGVHNYSAGVRLRAWIAFNQLLPVLKEKIEKGILPKQKERLHENHPTLDSVTIFKVKLSCDCDTVQTDSIPCVNHFSEK